MRIKLITTLLIAIGAITPIAAQARTARSAEAAIFRGKSDQGRPIQLATSPGQVTLVRFKVKMLCRDGSLLFGDASDFQASDLRANGSFADIQHGPNDVVSFKGRLKGRKLSGTIRVKDRLQSGVRCDSQPLGFTAKRVGGRR